MPSGEPSKYKGLGLLLFIVFLVTAGLILYGLFAVSSMPMNKIGRASALLAARSGQSIYLVKGVGILLSIPYFYAWSKLLPTATKAILGYAGPFFDPLYFFRDKWGWIIIGYLGVFYLVLAAASRDAYASKNCADTPEGLYMTDNTGSDPRYGQILKPCTLAQIEEKTHPASPKELSVAEVRQIGFFNISGYPQIWYSLDDEGTYRFFDRSGHSPQGDELSPVTRDIVASWSRDQKRLLFQRQAAERKHHMEDLEAVAEQTLAADSAQAQQHYQRGEFEQALASCKPVSAAHPADEDCRQVQHDASIKLAAQLAERAQVEVQHGELVDAERNAVRAARLDPTNQSARIVLGLAQQLRASR